MLLFIKHRFFHMPGLDIFLDNGSVNWLNLLKGYWTIDAAHGYPYAFAFWFIRNLMVFIILSPLAWIIGKRGWLTIVFFACYVVFDFSFYGFEWFVAGCFFSGRMELIQKPSTPLFIIASLVFWICALADAGNALPFICQVAATIYLTYQLAQHIKPAAHRHPWLNTLIGSTFMIYAVHQCFCTSARTFWAGVFGSANFLMPVCAYTCSFIMLTCSGVVTYIILRNISPRFLAWISGGR